MANRLEGGLLRAAAARAAERGFFIASQLAAYRMLYGLSESALAAWLGCQSDGLARLALCRRPEASAPSFRVEVEKIAARAGAKPERVAEVLREVEAVSAFRHARRSQAMRRRGLLLAARDRVEDAPPESNEPRKDGRRPRRPEA